MKKELFIFGLIFSLFPLAGHGRTLELPWQGYWPNVKGTSTPDAGPSASDARTPTPDAGPSAPAMPQEAAPMPVVPSQPTLSPPSSQSKALVVHTQPQKPIIVQAAAPVQISESEPTPLAKPVIQQKPTSAAAPVAPAAPAAQASAGGGTALAGLGAAFAALGSLGSNSQRSEPSRLNPSMGQGRTATENFNCVGKPPQQCQQEWDKLVQRIESMPGVRILNKQYGCSPQAIGMIGQYPGAMQTGYGVNPQMGGYPQQPYGGNPATGGYPQQPPQHHSTLTKVTHGLGGLFRR